MIGAIDIGGTKIAVGVVDAAGKILARRSIPTASAIEPDAAVALIFQILQECETESHQAVKGIGIGCTGPVDPVNGLVLDVDLLPGWNGFPLVKRLNDVCGVSVAMENDADAAALAESVWGAGRGTSRFVYVSIGTGIGTSLLLDGKIYRGIGGFHPEAGHHTIEAEGDRKSVV